MAEVYKKNTINAIYKSLNDRAKARCKTRFPDSPDDAQLCYYQAMADNARTMASKLRGQMGSCRNTVNPDKCAQQIDELIDYMEQKQEEYETRVEQLRDLKEG